MNPLLLLVMVAHIFNFECLRPWHGLQSHCTSNGC